MTTVKSITVQGTQVNARVIAAFGRRVGSLDDILSVWANAATLQAAMHGNRNWLDSLFAMPVLRLKNGDLSKAGKEVLAYITAHCPRVVWNKEKFTIGVLGVKENKEDILATHFVAVGATEESETIVQRRAKFYQPHGDFALTFSAFKNIEKVVVEKEESEPSMTAKAFVKQAEKALECFKAARFVGTPDELLSAMVKAKELFLAIDAELVKAEAAKQVKLAEAGVAATGADILDTAKADELHKSGQGGKATRAGNKVAA